MSDAVIISILVLIAFFAIRSSVKHLAGKGGCCGGSGSVKIRKKKLSKIKSKKVILVDGMTCNHCKGRVEEVVNDIDEVSGLVNLKKKELTISFANDITNEKLEEIYSKIEKAGYQIINK